jgi:hypothetical protein
MSTTHPAVDITERTKTCQGCLIAKPLNAFRPNGRITGERKPRHAFGVDRICRACRSFRYNPKLLAQRQERAQLDAAEVKRCPSCEQVKAYGDFAQSRNSPDGRCSSCRQCANERSRRWRQAHPKAHAIWYRANKEHKKQYFVEWKAKNGDRHRESYRRWARANPGRINALIARRNAAKLRATPQWADQAAIRAIYQEALRLTRQTGIRYEVDHIVPLRSPVVCGLHIAANLQILTSAANKTKSNNFPLAA